MDYSALIIMAIIQGVAECLPISSFAHLMLYTSLFAGQKATLMQTVAVEAGSVLALILYFRREIVNMARDWITQGFTRTQTFYSRMAWCLVIGTIPAGLAGLLFHDQVKAYFYSNTAIAYCALFFGVLMGVVDHYARKTRDLNSVTYKDALIIGLIQICALMPGASRSGVTMTAGRFLNLSRVDAAKFSFLLAIPVSVLAYAFQAKEAIHQGLHFDLCAFIVGAGISGVLSYIGITLLIRYIDKIGLIPFAIYRVILGVVMLALIANGALA